MPSSEGARARRYIEVVLDPSLAHAGFVAGWLESSAGQLARESMADGAAIPHVRASTLAEMPVMLPPLETQLRTLDTDSRLRRMAIEANELRTRLWLDPDGAAASTSSSVRTTLLVAIRWTVRVRALALDKGRVEVRLRLHTSSLRDEVRDGDGERLLTLAVLFGQTSAEVILGLGLSGRAIRLCRARCVGRRAARSLLLFWRPPLRCGAGR